MNKQAFIKKICEFYNISSNDFEILKFSGKTSDRCVIKCLKCGNIISLRRAEQFYRDRKIFCVNCIKKEKEQERQVEIKEKKEKDKELFLEQLKKRFPEEHIKIIKYNGRRSPGTVQCLTCNNTYDFSFISNIFNRTKKRVCIKCFPRVDTVEIFHKIEYIFKTNKILTLLEEPKNATDRLHIYCNKCKTDFYRIPYDFLRNQDCPFCNHCIKKTKDFFIRELKERTNDEYLLMGEYNGMNCSALFKHNPCGFIFSTTPAHIYRNMPCPKCRRFVSIGERKVEKFLKNNHIEYLSQKKFSELPQLSFDFYLPDFKILIEFQGEQHYQPVKFFGGEEKFRQQQANDNKKRIFCKENGYTLIEIKYDEIKNINKILNQKIVQRPEF